MTNLNIGLSNNDLENIIELLNESLADQYLLYTKLHNYHWNVTGPHFRELHLLYEDQYNQLAESIDETAERVTSLGGKALGTMSEFLEKTTLKEHPTTYPDASTMTANLLADHEAIIRTLRANVDACADQYHDQGTADFFTELLTQHEKMAWMLRATLAK